MIRDPGSADSADASEFKNLYRARAKGTVETVFATLNWQEESVEIR